jgi:hypothetical protein
MLDFAKTLQKSANKVHEAISLLRNFKDAEQIKNFCKEIDTLENDGDALLRKAMADLFNTKDTIEIIKTKELYDNMEAAIDRCRDVADAIGDILVKYV